MTPDDEPFYDDPDDPEPGIILEMEEGVAVWVMADRCSTCIYRPGNLMHLRPGHLQEMTRANLAEGTHITCHDTLLYGRGTRLRPAMCRGYADLPQARETSVALRLAASLGTLRFQQPQEDTPMSLLQRLALTGLVMDARNRYPHGIPPRSSGWEWTTWDITLHLHGRTLRRELLTGLPDVPPTVYEVMAQWLREACKALAARSAEHWAALITSDATLEWDPAAHYENARTQALELREFLGGGTGWQPWLTCLVEKDAENYVHTAHDLARRRSQGIPPDGVIAWYSVRAGEYQGVSVREILAVHAGRVVVAGWVIVKDGRYQVAGDGEGRWWTEWDEAQERVKERYRSRSLS
ncbi:MAG TPA: hypothetical protein VIM84_11045 [Gemmatimonadales bacterium]